MAMFAVPFQRSEEWNELRRRADEQRSVVEPKLEQEETGLRRSRADYPPPISSGYRLAVAKGAVSSDDPPTKWMGSSPVRFRG